MFIILLFISSNNNVNSLGQGSLSYSPLLPQHPTKRLTLTNKNSDKDGVVFLYWILVCWHLCECLCASSHATILWSESHYSCYFHRRRRRKKGSPYPDFPFHISIEGKASKQTGEGENRRGKREANTGTVRQH